MLSSLLRKVFIIVVHTFIITHDEPPFQEDRFILHSQGGGRPLGITIITLGTTFLQLLPRHNLLATFLGRSGSTNLFKRWIFFSHSSSVVSCTFISLDLTL